MNTIERLRARQDDLRLIWQDAIDNCPSRQHMIMKHRADNGETVVTEHAVIRRGFKVTYNHRMEVYELLAVHSGPMYKYATETEINQFLKIGFVRACDTYQITRHKRKIKSLEDKIKKANSDRNDSVITHWRNRRLELINDKSLIEENLPNWPARALKVFPRKPRKRTPKAK